MAKTSVKVGIVGCGVVGNGVVRMLRRKRAEIRRHSGVDVEIRKIAEKDISRVEDKSLPPTLLTTDMKDVLEDPDIRIVVELVGGKAAARELVLGALNRGKSVVTANKALLSAHWNEVFSLSRRTGGRVHFEASVMAGVPIVRSLHEGLAGNRVQSMMGILNGTTNFILTRMAERAVEFPKAVKEAQRRGLCEADPTLDVDGYDAAHKLSILGSLATGRWLPPEGIYTEGIRHVEQVDLETGREQLNCDLKLLAIYKRRGAAVEARVHPCFIPQGHPLAAVRDEFNAIYLENDAAGPVMLYGKGAGRMPAASGVVSDVIAVAQWVSTGAAGMGRYLAGLDKDPLHPVPMEAIESHYYLRFSTVDRPGVLSAITGALGAEGVSLATCYQRGRSDKGPVHICMTTHLSHEGAVRAAIEKIDAMKSIVKKKTAVIRIEE